MQGDNESAHICVIVVAIAPESVLTKNRNAGALEALAPCPRSATESEVE